MDSRCTRGLGPLNRGDTDKCTLTITSRLQGMIYMHNSKLVCHGALKSSNCLVDNRWMLKVTDYALGRFSARSEDSLDEENQGYKSQYDI
mgnify:CR=1 FL=1